ETAQALVIAGYDRRDAWVQEQDNDLQYAIEHVLGIASVVGAELFVDGALDEVVADGTVSTAGYRLIDYAAGKDSTADLAVAPAMQTFLQQHIARGGALFLSGEE